MAIKARAENHYIASCKQCSEIFEFPARNKEQVCTECQREDDNRVSEAVEMVVNTFGITKQDLTLDGVTVPSAKIRPMLPSRAEEYFLNAYHGISNTSRYARGAAF